MEIRANFGNEMTKKKQVKDEILSAYPEVMKPAQVQEALQISRATFFRMIEAETMPGAVRVGGSWRVLRDKLGESLLQKSH